MKLETNEATVEVKVNLYRDYVRPIQRSRQKDYGPDTTPSSRNPEVGRRYTKQAVLTAEEDSGLVAMYCVKFSKSSSRCCG